MGAEAAALRALTLLMLLLLGACATPSSGPQIDTRYSAQGQDSRALFLVIHYTALDWPQSLRILTQGEVSAHYLLSDESPPRIYRLVDENRRAWHAGASFWKGNAMLNAASIGIEIVSPGFVDQPQGRQWVPYPQAQIDVLIPLIQDIVKRHDIKPERILGHSDIAPQRKQDPGPLFPWKRLADLGIIPWPDAARVADEQRAFEQQLPDAAWFQAALARHGFLVPGSGEFDEATRNVISAFQMKYRPARFDGLPDAETAALLQVLTTPQTTPQTTPVAPR